MISLGMWLWAAASAQETFAISGDVGATARYLDHTRLADPTGMGLTVGLRMELDVKLQLRVDARYVEGTAFDLDEPRYVDLSAAASSPALLFLCLDVHEVFYRATTRPADDLLYVLPGLGFKGRIAGSTLKGTLGFAYLGAESAVAADPASALGGFAGVDLLVRTKWVDLSARGAVVAAFQESRLYGGLLLDGDLAVKIPAGPVWVGPRLDVTYRNLGLNPEFGRLFGLQHELGGHLAFAIGWGTGRRGRS